MNSSHSLMEAETHLASLHQSHDSSLIDEFAVLVDGLQNLVRFCFLLRSDSPVEIDPDL